MGVNFGSVVLDVGIAGRVASTGGGVSFVGLLWVGARSDDLRPAMDGASLCSCFSSLSI